MYMLDDSLTLLNICHVSVANIVSIYIWAVLILSVLLLFIMANDHRFAAFWAVLPEPTNSGSRFENTISQGKWKIEDKTD